MDCEFKLIEKDTDISQLKMHRLDWDVVIPRKVWNAADDYVGERMVPYQVARIEGYVHCYRGYGEPIDLWAWPLEEEPCYENMVEYTPSQRYGPVMWGIRYDPHHYTRAKWGESEIRVSGETVITRNGEDFYDCRQGILEAKRIIDTIDEHPLGFNERNYDKKMIGRKIWWRSEPAIISKWIKGQACVILIPDGIAKFTTPAEFAKEDGHNYYEDNEVKTTIFDEHIWWFRDDDDYGPNVSKDDAIKAIRERDVKRSAKYQKMLDEQKALEKMYSQR